MTRSTAVTKKAAESLAIQALVYIAEDPERIGPFLAATGLGPDDIRQEARQPDFLAGVLDYMLSDEALLVGFAKEAGLDPLDIVAAHKALGGTTYADNV